MALAFASSFHLATGRVKPLTSSNATRKLYSQMKVSGSATVAVDRTQVSEFELENKKHDLLSTIQGTQRGQNTNADQRSIIEEALVGLEGCNMGEPIDLVKLDGTWRLQYTSAPDVLVLFEAAARLPFFKVGQIFQKFECRDKSDGGVICNVVRWSVPPLLEKEEGATLVVSAKFDVVSVRNIYLQFEEVTVQNIYISEELQALIAPAILPRSFLSLQILQFIRAFKAQIPVTNTTPGRSSAKKEMELGSEETFLGCLPYTFF
ncbi:putative plastid-lipid-associated protein 10 [Citrus sinensis]|nr:putative plastid-lipid-associated protein 10 [Citrus sinensis]